MQPYYDDGGITILHADCRDALAAMAPASVDAICTDPPYGLEFMGKEWDRLDGADAPGYGERPRFTPDHMGKGFKALPNFYMGGEKAYRWHLTWLTEVYRVLKPGAPLIAFGGTRTFHRLACAIEDAGFQIFDSILHVSAGPPNGLYGWSYGSGFPKHKSLLKPAWEPALLSRKPLNDVPIDGIILEEAQRLLGGLICLSWSTASDAVLDSLPRLIEQSEGSVSAALLASALPDPESGDSSEATAMFNSPATARTCSNIASSWSSILAALSNPESTFTTSTVTELTTALRTLNCLLSGIIPASIIEAVSRPLGWLSSADTAARPSTDGHQSKSDTPSAIAPVLASLRHARNGTDAQSAAERLRPIIPSVATVLSHALQPLITESAANSGPRLEPIIVAKRPGSGGLRTEAGRLAPMAANDPSRRGLGYGFTADGDDTASDLFHSERVAYDDSKGRYPPNVALSHVPPGPDGTGGCTRIGDRRVKTAYSQPMERQTSSVGFDGGFSKTEQAIGYADPDGLETVESWSCQPECVIAALDRQAGERTSRGAKDGSFQREMTSRGYPGGGIGQRRAVDHDPVDLKKPDYGDTGGASRFFKTCGWEGGETRMLYCPKAPRSERTTGPNGERHPTVKPLALMSWLVKLCAGPGDLILDPFMGSGTTLVAARALGVRAIGIDSDESSCAIAAKRLADTVAQLDFATAV